jgi:dienelactone hydrolase
MVRKPVTASRVAVGTAIVVGVAAFAGVVALASLSVYVARKVITPSKTRIEDLRIIDSTETTVTLSITLDTLVPGEYSLWFGEGTGHAKIGQILETGDDWVRRELFAVDYGELAVATRGYLAGWFYLGPEQLGFPFEDVEIATPLGAAPAWVIPAEKPSTRWLIGTHGRGVRRQETLRAVEVARRCGYNSLLTSYRNDGDAPHSADGRYALGDTEWRDVDAALEYAIARGATEVVLMGWSMGGSISLQLATRSEHAGILTGIILESPVVDWIPTLRYQATALHVPRPVSAVAAELLVANWSRKLTGHDEPIDLNRLDFVARADELTLPILLLHSADDGYVPPDASRALAAARPDIVSYDEFRVARHTKLWNYDPDRWNAAIGEWLIRLG